MRYTTLILSLVIFTQTTFAVESPLESPKPQSNKQSNVKAWWTDRDAGWVGGISGSAVGLMGAAIGIMGGFGVARKICLSLLGLYSFWVSLRWPWHWSPWSSLSHTLSIILRSLWVCCVPPWPQSSSSKSNGNINKGNCEK